MLAAVALMFVVCMFLNKRYIGGVLTLIAVLLAGIVILAGELGIFSNILLRLELGTGDLTTGRIRTWGRYIAYLNAHWIYWFTGTGIGAEYLNGLAPHNTYIDFLYYYGLVGTGAFLGTCFYAIGKNENRIKLINLMPLACLMVMNIFLSSLDFFDFAFTLIFAFFAVQTDFACLPKQERIKRRTQM